jgi:hypothetical protein
LSYYYHHHLFITYFCSKLIYLSFLEQKYELLLTNILMCGGRSNNNLSNWYYDIKAVQKAKKSVKSSTLSWIDPVQFWCCLVHVFIYLMFEYFFWEMPNLVSYIFHLKYKLTSLTNCKVFNWQITKNVLWPDSKC